MRCSKKAVTDVRKIENEFSRKLLQAYCAVTKWRFKREFCRYLDASVLGAPAVELVHDVEEVVLQVFLSPIAEHSPVTLEDCD